MTPKYSYKARDPSGNLIKGSQETEDRQSLIQELKSDQLYIVEIKQTGKEFSFSNLKKYFQKPVASRDLMIFSRQFATMIKAGVTVLDSLESLSEQMDSKKLSRGLVNVTESLRGGNSLAESFHEQKDVFPELFVNMISAGEEAGALEDVLERMAVHYEKEHQLLEKIKSAMTYPVILLGVAFLVVYFLVTYVLPEFAGIFAGMDVELPLLTEIMLFTGKALRANIQWLLIILIVLSLAGYYLLNTDGGKYLYDKAKLTLPVLGGVSKKVIIARFSRILTTLIGSGITLMDALGLVKKTIGNKLMEKVLDEAVDNIEQGQTMSKPFEESELFPPLVSKMMSVGEETGAIEEMMDKVADFYEQESSYTLDRLSALIEPVMILILMVVVAVIVLAVVLPMVEMWQIY
ncbi:type II secretion system F family protein [Natranaerobius thermophilus]|uniref:Type II secretion system protein n=1 Tax=Natranaerobius thermophilus (strain ATCC BAA-1301 / DSM 18059 / JW/NM-WN-LF) TaxID=457570 RepID=B2A7F9_NATTJ|nr:type II secretion system F family protein [Natranaerobius thermophilus]ACB85668.1 type II secretion system protein [Natranaerobius thermophilus JW/NM-WN-LF]